MPYKTSKKERDYQVTYRAEHRKELSAYWANFHIKNRKKILAYQAKYRPGHRKEHSINALRWQAKNPEKVNSITSNYRHRKNAGGGSFSYTTWEYLKALFGSCCAYCKKRVKLTQDHVIPISKGGWHFSGNIVPACQPCNSSKGNRI